MDAKKIFKILSYIGPLFLISLIVPEKDDSGVKLHCGQGMLLFIAEIILGIVAGIISAILVLIPVIGILIAGLINTVISLAFLAFAILGIVNAATDKDVPLPVIRKFAFYK